MIKRVVAIAVVLVIISPVFAGEKKISVDPAATEELIKLRAQEIELRKKIKEQEKKIHRHSTPAERQARKEVESAEKNNTRQVKAERDAILRSGLSGCEPGTVWVNPDSTATRTWFAYAKVNITNLEAVPVTIRDNHRGHDVVKNLCPGGRLTLMEILSPWLEGNQQVVSYTATGRFLDGNIGTSQSPTVFLNTYQVSYQQGQVVVWEVRLQKWIPNR